MNDRAESGGTTAIEQLQWRMDALIGTLLMLGVIVSLSLLAAGLIWEAMRTGHATLNYRISGMSLYQFVVATVRTAAHAQSRPRELVNAGLIALMLTPYLRVLASVVWFSGVVRNVKYTCFTLFVLAVLTWSLFLRA